MSEIEPIAYMHNDPKRVNVIHSEVKKLLQDVASGSLHRPIDKSSRYTIPLYSESQMKALQSRLTAKEAECTRLREAARWVPFSEKNPEVGQKIWIHDGFVVWSYCWSGKSKPAPDWKAWKCREEKPAVPTQQSAPAQGEEG